MTSLTSAPSPSDHLIIGGGPAGCVLANRLSETGARVTLVEAGPDAGGAHDPAEMGDARCRVFGDLRFFWPGLFAEYSRSGIGQIPFKQARVLGGGSSINGMHAQRGLPTDYDEWRQLGVEGWGWDDLLPFFKALETDEDFADDAHGRSGPLRVRRVPQREWSALSRAFAAVARDKGLPWLGDLNGETGDGYGPVPINAVGDRRLSAATAFLSPEVRARPNLNILTGAEVSKLLCENGAITGAVCMRAGEQIVLHARDTIVSAGAIHSPALLMRSGIGPAEDLRAAGIDVIADRPGVGANLNNHPIIVLSAHLKRAARAPLRAALPSPMLIRHSSGIPGCPETDMLLNVWERAPNALAWDPFGRQVANFFPTVNKVFSSGSVRLTPGGGLDVRFNALEDVRDMDRMVLAVRMAHAYLSAPAVAPLVNAAFLPAFTPLARTLMGAGWKAQALSVAAATALSGPRALRDRLLREAGTPLADILSDEAALRTRLKKAVLPGGHVSGTCRMGDPEQKTVVLDSRCRVVGVSGLRVVDASIFPTLMAAGCNVPVMMAAHKAARMIVEDARA